MIPLAGLNKDPRLETMGGIGVAVTGRNVKSYPNPASLFFDDQDFSFVLRTQTAEILGYSSLPALPQLNFGGFFCADMVSFSLDVNFDCDNRRSTRHDDVYRTTSIGLDLCAGYGNISAGLGISGGSLQQRIDVPLESYFDLVNQFFLTPYDRVVKSEYFQVNLGLMYKKNAFSFGLLLDNILDKVGLDTTLTWESVFSETRFGFYYARDEYSKRGKMNNYVFSAGADINNVFSQENRSLNVGAEATFRFVRDFSMSVRSGYSAELNEIKNGVLTIGFGSQLRQIEISLAFSFSKIQQSKVYFAASYQI
ncbi:MAG: hypothetical protein HUK23_02630 [Sphaerochaetaceae bacterium]|nr:hypothetical protein [Sphaerochaetaceae bacterium]